MSIIHRDPGEVLAVRRNLFQAGVVKRVDAEFFQGDMPVHSSIVRCDLVLSQLTEDGNEGRLRVWAADSFAVNDLFVAVGSGERFYAYSRKGIIPLRDDHQVRWLVFAVSFAAKIDMHQYPGGVYGLVGLGESA